MELKDPKLKVEVQVQSHTRYTKTFPKCYVRRNGKQNHTHTSVLIAQDTTESRVPRLK